MSNSPKLTIDDFKRISSNDELLQLIKEKNISIDKVNKDLFYEEELRRLQIELVKLQHWILKTNKRVVIIFEGRDAAGKGGNIRRFTEHLNPRSMRVVALTKPTEVERGQWYFRRYIKELPDPGEMVFFDRSWYNRAVVEPVMGFCTDEQYNKFMVQVPEFEHMLYEDGTTIIKLWFSISKDVQLSRFNSRLSTPLKRWKFSPVDKKGQELWDTYTHFREQMFSKTHTSYSPWITVKANNKKIARLESIRYVLSQFDYEGKDNASTTLLPDPNVIMRYYRSSKQLN
ncbi:MAG: polyphosphate kinase 2 [Lutibacter sp.]|uniref:polyphosphate kinase 2 n=1 Tax=Lutibacter sp. TaxID=1925666 RepID=UPI0017BBC8E4|nr:polyphosphate kinase 2 [Lutibacter sp.]MBT8317818.1 polyphosphate kinase 2 [Lutibacter sp.]NNJ58676.1 polyphosphate kinase 2 [Lutibacter sp.]